mmetsp:Transcript_56815/g.101356  ORF Transcript_56815/g.101356 Transcript_56815/m.101356 type:complete len:233 (-) Transcript_56815:1483-2181(-)
MAFAGPCAGLDRWQCRRGDLSPTAALATVTSQPPGTHWILSLGVGVVTHRGPGVVGGGRVANAEPVAHQNGGNVVIISGRRVLPVQRHLAIVRLTPGAALFQTVKVLVVRIGGVRAVHEDGCDGATERVAAPPDVGLVGQFLGREVDLHGHGFTPYSDRHEIREARQQPTDLVRDVDCVRGVGHQRRQPFVGVVCDNLLREGVISPVHCHPDGTVQNVDAETALLFCARLLA